MSATLFAVAAVLAVGLLYVVSPIAADAYLRFRGKRVVTCPETRRPAAVDVDAPRAALSAALGRSNFRLNDCSRWPAKKDCGQDCLAQIEASPEDCLVRTHLKQWYEGKSCVLCGQGFGTFRWTDHTPALMTDDHRVVAWSDLRADKLDEAFASHLPVCWNCSITETVRQRFPDRMIYRNRPAPPREHS